MRSGGVGHRAQEDQSLGILFDAGHQHRSRPSRPQRGISRALGFYRRSECRTSVGHIFKTIDFGNTWTRADAGLPDIPVLKVLVDANDSSGNARETQCSNSVFVGTDIGVFHSSDGGTSWQPFNLT